MGKKVLLILVDGLRPDALMNCGSSWLEEYFLSGLHSGRVRTVYPSVTLPCHMSLFHSVTPDRHGILTNVYVPQSRPVKGLIEAIADAGKRTAMFYTWEELRDICTPGLHLSYSWFMSGEAYNRISTDLVAAHECIRHLGRFGEDFSFLYLGKTDQVGHDHGWMSPEYLACVRRAGECIREVAEALGGEYTVILTADHGGHGRNHGEDVPEDMTVPLSIHGEGIKAGELPEGVSILDVAPTVTALLNVPAPGAWDGKSLIMPVSIGCQYKIKVE